MLERVRLISQAVAALAVAAFFALLTWRVYWAPDVLGHLDATIASANKTLEVVNAPCVGFHGSVTCGPIAQLAQTEKNVGIVAGQTALQVKQSGKLVDAATLSLQDVSVHAGRSLDALDSQVTHLAPLLDSGTALLTSAKVSTDRLPSLLDASTATVNDVDALMRRNATHLDSTLANVDGMTSAGVGILNDSKRVADKFTDDYVTPRPWYKKAGRFAGDAFDYGALFARHVP